MPLGWGDSGVFMLLGFAVILSHLGTLHLRIGWAVDYQEATPAAPPLSLQFSQKTFYCVDISKRPAFKLLIPDGWTATGKARWLPNNPVTPAVGTVSISSPKGDIFVKEQLILSSAFSSAPLSGMKPDASIGDGMAGGAVFYSRINGKQSGHLPPADLCDTLVKNWQREHHVQDVQIVSRGMSPDMWSRYFGPGGWKDRSESSSVTLTYFKYRRKFVAKLFATLECEQTHSSASPNKQDYWGAWLLTHEFEVSMPLEVDPAAEARVTTILANSAAYREFLESSMLRRVTILDRLKHGDSKGTANSLQAVTRPTLPENYHLWSENEARNLFFIDSEAFSSAPVPLEFLAVRGCDLRLPRGFSCGWTDDRGHYIISTDRCLVETRLHAGSWRALAGSELGTYTVSEEFKISSGP